MSDQLTYGRRLRILCVVDDCSRECLTLTVDTSLLGGRVARELDLIIAERGQPKMIVSELTPVEYARNFNTRRRDPALGSSLSSAPVTDAPTSIQNGKTNRQSELKIG